MKLLVALALAVPSVLGFGGYAPQFEACTTFWTWVGKNWVHFDYLGIAGVQGLSATSNCLLSQPLGGYECEPINKYAYLFEASPFWKANYLVKCDEGFTGPSAMWKASTT